MTVFAPFVIDAGVIFMAAVAAKVTYFDLDMKAVGVGILAVGIAYGIELIADVMGD